eukprot:COSAG06_NODE_6271_length_3003_cov_1.238981_3_plen_249_part_00
MPLPKRVLGSAARALPPSGGANCTRLQQTRGGLTIDLVKVITRCRRLLYTIARRAGGDSGVAAAQRKVSKPLLSDRPRCEALIALTCSSHLSESARGNRPAVDAIRNTFYVTLSSAWNTREWNPSRGALKHLRAPAPAERGQTPLGTAISAPSWSAPPMNRPEDNPHTCCPCARACACACACAVCGQCLAVATSPLPVLRYHPTLYTLVCTTTCASRPRPPQNLGTDPYDIDGSSTSLPNNFTRLFMF